MSSKLEIVSEWFSIIAVLMLLFALANVGWYLQIDQNNGVLATDTNFLNKPAVMLWKYNHP